MRLEYQGEIWVFSGDYKLTNDGLSGEFEPVKCHTFITESTFGLPIYKWKPQQQIYDEIRNWIRDTHSKGKIPVINCRPERIIWAKVCAAPAALRSRA